MTSKILYRLLRKSTSKVHWFLNGSGAIRATVKPNGPYWAEMCPLTAIHYLLTGDEYSACDVWFRHLPEHLNLSDEYARRVVSSADGQYVMSNGKRFNSHKQVRQALLRATNLSEAVTG